MGTRGRDVTTLSDADKDQKCPQSWVARPVSLPEFLTLCEVLSQRGLRGKLGSEVRAGGGQCRGRRTQQSLRWACPRPPVTDGKGAVPRRVSLAICISAGPSSSSTPSLAGLHLLMPPPWVPVSGYDSFTPTSSVLGQVHFFLFLIVCPGEVRTFWK